jgi:hypothetical protein
VFIGVEGAVVVSARARNKRDVGRATLLAVLAALGVYLLVTLLSLGVVARPELAGMRNPSMAGLMVKMMGPDVFPFLRASLDNVSTWVRAYYDTNDATTTAFLEEVDKLSQQNITMNVPDKLESQPVLEKLMQTRVRNLLAQPGVAPEANAAAPESAPQSAPQGE